MSAADLAIRAIQEQRKVGGSDTARLQQVLRERAVWYRDGCDGLDDLGAYLRDGLATDAASDLDEALKIIDAQALVLRTVQQERDFLSIERQRLVDWRAEVTVALRQEGGICFKDVPRAIRTLRSDSEAEREQHYETSKLVASLRADVARLTGERDAFKRLHGEAEGKVVDLLADVETAEADRDNARRQLGVVQSSCRISERLAATAEQHVLALLEGIEQLLVSVEATHDVTQWFASIAKLSALLAAIKET